jgi:hypothetical protein
MTAPLGRAAVALAARGLRVFPCVERGKEPALHDGFKRATTDPNMITGWWRIRDHNIGVATGPGSGVWVLDIDGEDGEATLRKLEAVHGALPPTVEAITGKGRHLYFRWLTGTNIRNTQVRDDIPGLDVRGDGGYVLAPPSIHPSGRAYAWSVDSANEFADAPDWLIEIVTGKSRSDGALGSATTPEQWLSFLAERVDGSHRAAAIARLTGHLLRHFIDPAITIDLCRFFNSLRCDPPLSDEELVRIIDNIARRELARRQAS